MKQHYIPKCIQICDQDRKGNPCYTRSPEAFVVDYAVPLGCLPWVAGCPYLVGSAFGAVISCLGWGWNTAFGGAVQGVSKLIADLKGFG